jgi:hypothetical protein
MIIIDSIEVIPMSKDSKFEAVDNDFEVYGITTEFSKWFEGVSNGGTDATDFGYDHVNGECLAFARKQQAFMTAPTAIFAGQLYQARTIKTESLDGSIQGPLYQVFKKYESDTTKGKTVEGEYLNEKTLMIEKGLGYPTKPIFMIRYGVIV